MAEDAVFRVAGLRKSFGPIQVLGGVDLELRSGEVIVLMGANGAGKSTLVKIVSGVYQRDGGRMTLAGVDYRPASPAEAMRAGVVTVHQNINDGVVAALDVATNLTLDRLSGKNAPLLFNPRRIRREARAVAERMGLDLDLGAEIADLSLADRQMVAIARAMAHEPKVLILDEPTSSLSSAEANRLFALIDRLRAAAWRSSTSRTACQTSAGSPTVSCRCATGRSPASSPTSRSTTRARSTPCSASRWGGARSSRARRRAPSSPPRA